MDPDKISLVQAQLFLEEMEDCIDVEVFLSLTTTHERRIMTARWMSRPENVFGLKVIGISARRVIRDNTQWFAYMAQALRPVIRLDMFRYRTYHAFCRHVESQGGAAVEWVNRFPMFYELRELSQYDPEEFRSELWRISRLDENIT